MKYLNFLLGALLPAVVLTSCSPNNINKRGDWAKHFSDNGVEGCFMLYNNGTGDFDIYNVKRTQQRFLPASTFKIMNSLVGLETGVISDTGMVIQWDGIRRPVEAWNQDLTMGQAFRYSAVPYYQEVARRTGREVMQQWLDTVKYGNMVIGPHIDSFWLDNSLKISPDEELGFVTQLYFSKLPFQERSQRLVRGVMLMEKTPQYQLSYKTGWGFTGDRQIGWIAGWEEENNHPYFFVLNIEAPDSLPDFDKIRFRIFRAIMQQEGFFNGRK